MLEAITAAVLPTSSGVRGSGEGPRSCLSHQLQGDTDAGFLRRNEGA